jgi:hypothetical protein
LYTIPSNQMDAKITINYSSRKVLYSKSKMLYL